MTVVWLRERDGTLLQEVSEWSRVRNPTRRRRLENGECVLSIPLSDPCMDGDEGEDNGLLWETPEDPAKPWKDWSDANIELALWAAGTPGEDDPTWAGPIVGGSLGLGRLEVRAYTQEAYLQPVGGPLNNYFGFSAFSVDTDLSEWDTSEATASTVTTGPVWTDGYAALVDGRMSTAAIPLPFSAEGNYADIVVPFWVPADNDEVTGVGTVYLFTDDEGEFAFPDPYEDAWFLVVPGSWSPGGWQLARVRVPQPAGREVLFRVEIGSADGSVRFGSPRLWRPENAGSPAGEDIGVVLSALYDQQIDLLPGTWTRSNDEVGTDLREPVRYMSVDHPDVKDAVNDWPHGEGWVDEMVMHWSPTRGVERATLDLDLGTLETGWSYTVDSTGAATIIVGQFTLGDASDEVWVGDGLPNRLTRVVQVPDSIAASDIPDWLGEALADAGPRRSLNGVPGFEEVPSAAGVALWNPGDWVTLNLSVPRGGALDPLVVTVTLVMDGTEWDPVTQRVTADWIVEDVSGS